MTLKHTLLKSDYIILRKIPYQESSLIVSGLSPHFGRLDFLLKGARSHQTKRFPYAGLFRVLAVEFKEKDSSANTSTLYYMSNYTALLDFDAIAGEMEHYLAMCEYASFLLKHTRPMLEMPLTYQALLCALHRLCGKQGTLFDLAAAKLVFFHESGLLPETPGEDENSQHTLRQILEYALVQDSPLPPFREAYKKQLCEYAEALCRYAQEN